MTVLYQHHPHHDFLSLLLPFFPRPDQTQPPSPSHLPPTETWNPPTPMETITNSELEAAFVLQQLRLTPSTARAATRHWGLKKRRSSARQQPRSPVYSPNTSGEAVAKPGFVAGGSPVSPFRFDHCEEETSGGHFEDSRRTHGHHRRRRRRNERSSSQLAKPSGLPDLEVVDPTAYPGDLADLSPRFWSLAGGGRSRVVDPTACFAYGFSFGFGVVGQWEEDRKAVAAEARRRRVEIKRKKAAAAAAAAVVLPRKGRGSTSNAVMGPTR